MEAPSCPVCLDPFAESPETKVPRLLPCGHTFCHACVSQLASKRGMVMILACPNRCETEVQLTNVASDLPKNFALIDSLRPSSSSDTAKADTELARLEAEKKKAVESEDYDLAKKLKAQIEALLQTSISENCKVELVDLGAQGQLIRVDPRSPEPQPGTRPTAVVVLDRSPSMGDTVRWAINMAMPEALQRLGYQAQDRIMLITFDSVAERVQVDGGHDPTVAHLPTINIKARGRTTLMTGAMQLLGQILQAPGRYNVFVISDGFVKDMQASLQQAEESIRRVPASTIGAFALFRFFNGSPPDTQALAAAASLGTTGLAPCTDCVIRRETLQEAMEDFVRTAEEAFGGTSSRHVVVEGPSLQRVPLKDSRHQTLRLEIPTSSVSTLLLPAASRSAGTGSLKIRINGVDYKVEVAENPGEILAEYATFALAQLRLWLVGRVRKEDLQEATAWFKQASENDATQQGGAVLAGSCGLLERAKKQAWQKANSETPIARIAALAELGPLIHTLTSKQQGDFLRGGSVARADRLVIRRALGSDIVYHDSLRQSLPDAAAMAADLPSAGAPDGTGEAAFVSSYGGGEYLDILHAAAVLAPVAEDLSAPEVLQVIGGLGIPFAAELPRRTDDPWGLEVTSVNPSAFLNEADVWAARQEGNPLKLPSGVPITGVVPLAMCSTQAHECYINGVLQPVALLQLASQLRGELPEKPWGWDQAPPFSFLAGIAAREAAVLMCLASESLGSTRQPSQNTANLLAQLVRQLQEKSQHCPALTVSDLAADIGLRPKHSMLQAFAAVVADPSLSRSMPAMGEADRKDEVAAAARSLYMLEVHSALQRRGDEVGLPAHAKAARCAAAVSLLAEDPASQQPQVQRDVVLMHINSRLDSGTLGEINIPSMDSTVAAEEVIAERLQAMQWVPSLDRVLGTFRLHAAGADAGRLQNDDPISPAELFFNADQGEAAASGNFANFLKSFRDANLVVAAVLGSMLCPEEGQQATTGALASAAPSSSARPSLARRLDSREHTRMELKKILHRALFTAYTSRLREEVSRELAEMKAKKLEESAAIRGRSMSANEMPLNLDRGLPPDGWGPRRKDLPHLPFVLCGPCDSGKSTLGMRLLFELGHVGDREMMQLCQEAERLGKPSFTFAFGLDDRKEERERGISIGVKKKEFFSDRWHFTMIDVPGHRNFMKAMLNGMAQVDLAVLVVSRAAVDFAKGFPQAGEPEGQARTNAILLRTMGVQHLIVCVNKMDNSKYGEEMFEEVVNACKEMLTEVGFDKDFINKSVAFLPTCGWSGENLVTRSATMPWWSGTEVETSDGRTCVTTLAEALNAAVPEPSIDPSTSAADSTEFLMPITGVFRIRGVGRVLTGRVLAGEIKPGETVQYFREGQSKQVKVKTIEMHRAPHELARRGDIVGLAVTFSDPIACVGDVLTGAVAGQAASCALRSFEAKVFLTSPLGDIKVGWAPLCFAHTTRGCVALRRIMWKDTGGKKEENPSSLKKGDTALVEFQVRAANFYVEPFEKRRFLGRLLLVEGHHVVMIGKVTATTPVQASSYGYRRR